MNETRFKTVKQLPSSHLLGSGTPMCAGCGGLEALHQIYDIIGEKSVFINAAGCMTLLSVYPFTPFRGSWLYTAMASAPAEQAAAASRCDVIPQILTRVRMFVVSKLVFIGYIPCNKAGQSSPIIKP